MSREVLLCVVGSSSRHIGEARTKGGRKRAARTIMHLTIALCCVMTYLCSKNRFLLGMVSANILRIKTLGNSFNDGI